MHGHEQTTGAAIGGILGFAKSILTASFITWPVVADTLLLSAIGAATGFLVTGLLKVIKAKWKKLRS